MTSRRMTMPYGEPQIFVGVEVSLLDSIFLEDSEVSPEDAADADADEIIASLKELRASY